MIKNKISVQKMIKKLVNVIKEIDKENDIEIPFSGIVHREDRVCKNVIDDTSHKLKSYCASVGRGFINNDNIDGSCQIEANYTWITKVLVFWLKI